MTEQWAAWLSGMMHLDMYLVDIPVYKTTSSPPCLSFPRPPPPHYLQLQLTVVVVVSFIKEKLDSRSPFICLIRQPNLVVIVGVSELISF